MQTYIALIRGINVGGRNKLPMNTLVDILLELDCFQIKTHIQSGNVVFRSAVQHPHNLERRIAEAINIQHGFLPQVLVLNLQEMEAAVAGNPYQKACDEGNSLHLYFLTRPAAKPDFKKLHNLQGNSERFSLQDRVFYLHAPDGIGRSKVAANIEKSLGVKVTARNWNTVCKVLELAHKEG